MKLKEFISNARFISATVWIARIVIGSCFIFAGFAKADDPWGMVFKIEQYLSAWGFSEPRSLVVAAAFAIAVIEFILGVAVLLGIYRRIAPRGVALMMLVFLPLTGYIAFTSPVDDCGCFGDAWVISNTMTFVKNILLTILTIPLLLWNRKIATVFTPGLQWIVSTISTTYIFIVAMVGYHIQPLVDFRPFPIGSALISDYDTQESSTVFIYRKDGIDKEFEADKLPSRESGWEFVARKAVETTSNIPFIIEDKNGDDITEELLGYTDSDRLLLIIPEPSRTDLASTMQINQLWRMTSAVDSVAMIALIGDADTDDIDKWKDLSMAEYPIYSAESTSLKALSRGLISAVYIHQGTISAKISMSALSTEDLLKAENDNTGIENALSFNGKKLLQWLSILYFGALCVMFLAALPRRIYLLHKLRKE